MKNSPTILLIPLIVLAVCCLYLPAGAQMRASLPYQFENLLQFDFRISYFDYKEDLPAPLKSTEKGWIPGGAFGWTRTKPGSIYARTFLEFSSGDIEYDGTTQTGEPIINSNSNQFLFRVEGNIGYTFNSGNLVFSPYTGFGYRYWERGDSPQVVNLVAFMRIMNGCTSL